MVPIELPSSTVCFFNLSMEIDNFEENIWYYENKIY